MTEPVAVPVAVAAPVTARAGAGAGTTALTASTRACRATSAAINASAADALFVWRSADEEADEEDEAADEEEEDTEDEEDEDAAAYEFAYVALAGLRAEAEAAAPGDEATRAAAPFCGDLTDDAEAWRAAGEGDFASAAATTAANETP